jgi:thioredoxin reductase (NADPH)
MTDSVNKENRQELDLDQVQDQIKNLFKNIPNDISMLLFTSPGKNDVFSDANRQIIRAFRELTSRIDLKEFDTGHKEAKKRNIKYSPTLLIDPDRYNIRWYGAPLGEEAKTFAEAVMMIGYGETGIGDEGKKVLERISDRRDIKVFVSPT